jgi:hypothetical protein
VQDGDQLVRRNAVGRVGGEVEERDPTLAVDDDVGPELERVVPARHAHALTSEDSSETRGCDARAYDPERLRPAGAECPVESPFRIGDHQHPLEGELVSPGPGPSGALGRDDNELRAS